ncbi:hypothetical protein HETIRDRAFT_98975 [Heterobasidion irregulare TC 32-1]|uniref:Uncharacterized protein n=1 Tax=Heterobasidion irregulare (strain TC 32-1) TaxID=747525 RepID=W4KKV9_HETIT|nr:uncharacterized protein HETIRDRAFT_98975 [Heterobasidion irregulare TC 32-1]ETW86457.1 hypothetical protein HETIRDRAFT_98975 [Heterobasidion irregulare TC 32-1]
MVDRVWARYFMIDLKSPIQQSPIESIYEGAEVFEYRLFPLDKDLRPIKRFDEPDSTKRSLPLNADPTEQNSTHHSYPFDSLPILVSSVQPHFVILDLAEKLFNQPRIVSTVVPSLWPISEYDASHMLWHLEFVYCVWLEIEAPPGFASTSRTPLWASALDAGACLPTSRPMSLTVCTGPCFRSRFAWQPSVCSRCLHTGDDSMSDDSAASDSDDDFRSLSPSE